MADPGKIAQKHLDLLHGLVAWVYPVMSVAFAALLSQPEAIAKSFGVELFHVSTVLWLLTLGVTVMLLRTLLCLQELTAEGAVARSVVCEELRTYPTLTNPFFESKGKLAVVPNSLGPVLLGVAPALLFVLGLIFFYDHTLTPLLTMSHQPPYLREASYYLGHGAFLIGLPVSFLAFRSTMQLLGSVPELPTTTKQKELAVIFPIFVVSVVGSIYGIVAIVTR